MPSACRVSDRKVQSAWFSCNPHSRAAFQARVEVPNAVVIPSQIDINQDEHMSTKCNFVKMIMRELLRVRACQEGTNETTLNKLC